MRRVPKAHSAHLPSLLRASVLRPHPKMPHNTTNLPANMKRLRDELGLTKIALASNLGVGRRFVGKLEAGDKVPSVPRLIDLARALGVTPNDLLDTPTEEREQK